MKHEKNLEIIGFDLGHGETAISRTWLFSTSEPQAVDIDGKTSILTAVGMLDGRIVVGEDACISRDIKKLSILFKSFNLEKRDVREPIEKFVRRCLEILREQNKIVGDQNTYFFVGAPSNWSIDQKLSYERVLKSAGMTNVLVRPESRAAFLDAKESGEIAQDHSNLSDLVIIIDIGSSTTDFTVVENYQEKPMDFGNNQLGGGLIDELIFERALEAYPEDYRAKLRTIFSENPELEVICKLKARTAKERYFSKSDDSDWINSPSEETYKLGKGIFFEIEVYKRDMEEIICASNNKLDGKSWVEAFREELVKCRLSTKKYPKLILMTGGGSRMRFTTEICREVFPDVKIRVGLEPNLTISKGLARLGRMDFKVQSFRVDVDGLIESEKFLFLLKDEVPKLIESLSNTAIDRAISIASENFEKWAECDLKTLGNMEEQIKSEMNDLFEYNQDFVFQKDLENWLMHLGNKIEIVTHEICDKYKIPRTTFNLYLESSIQMEPFEINIASNVTNLISGVTKAVLSITAAMIAVLLLPITLGTSSILIGGGLMWGIFGDKLKFSSNQTVSLLGGWTKDKSVEIAKTIDVPKTSRKFLISKVELRKEIESHREEFRRAVKDQLEEEFFGENGKIREIFLPIKEALYRKADEAAILIE